MAEMCACTNVNQICRVDLSKKDFAFTALSFFKKIFFREVKQKSIFRIDFQLFSYLAKQFFASQEQ